MMKTMAQRTTYRVFGKDLYSPDVLAGDPLSKIPRATLLVVDDAAGVTKLIDDGYDLSVCPFLKDAVYGVGKGGAAVLLVFSDKTLIHASMTVYNGTACVDRAAIKAAPSGAGYIGPCYTDPAQRGRGIYPYVLGKACAFLRSKGKRTAVISTKETNSASVKGILKAGFDPIASVDCSRFLFWKTYRSVPVPTGNRGAADAKTPRDSNAVAARYRNESLVRHWQVDETPESFSRLLHHLESRTRIRAYFEDAMRSLGLDGARFPDGVVAADIGAGVCWTSGIMARHPNVRTVYAVDPSANRLAHGRFVARHFGVEDKVRIVQGTFAEPNVPEKVDVVVLCGSLHHCFDGQMGQLFSNIQRLLKPGGSVLIACEHYVTPLWIAKKFLSYARHFSRRAELYYYPLSKLRSPEPFGGEHWRTRGELERIFAANGFDARFRVHPGDMCRDKPTVYHRIGWRYYHAILTPRVAAGTGGAVR